MVFCHLLSQSHPAVSAEFVVFITPTPIQLAMFTKILNPNRLDDLIQSSTAESLALINILTKISNSPILLKATADSIKGKNGVLPSMQQSSVAEALGLLPDKAHIADISLSGMLHFFLCATAPLTDNNNKGNLLSFQRC